MSSPIKFFIFFIAFTEGANLMAIELGAAKLLAPFFGTSLYAWAATLGVTLLALMIGYLVGGVISARYYSEKKLFLVLFLASCFICIAPIFANYFLNKLYMLPVQLGSTIGLLSYAFLPLFFLAVSSPLMIQYYLPNTTSAGSAAGSVYAVSTLGGIFATFFCGFYALPNMGISNTLLAFSFILFLLSFLLISFKSKLLGIVFIILYALCAILANGFKEDKNLIYHSEGVLGEIKIKDGKYFSFMKNNWVDGRAMIINGTGQSIIDLSNTPSYTWHYMEVAKKIAKRYRNKKCLLLGMGAGIAAKEIAKENIAITAVELDKRIPEIAEKYFIGENNFTVFIDDARHFINSNQTKYDFIFIDLFFSETPPSHVLTLEAFSRIKKMLNAKGSLLINLYGFSSGKNAAPLHSINKTLKESGYFVQPIATAGSEEQRNILLLATTNASDILLNNTENYTLLNITSDNSYPIITDDKNPLEVMFVKPASVWRKGWNALLGEKKN